MSDYDYITVIKSNKGYTATDLTANSAPPAFYPLNWGRHTLLFRPKRAFCHKADIGPSVEIESDNTTCPVQREPSFIAGPLAVMQADKKSPCNTV